MSDFALRDVLDWNAGVFCTPTALAAVSGKSLQEIGGLLGEAASFNGRYISNDLRQDYHPEDWRLAILRMNGCCEVIANFAALQFDERPTIADWMQSRPSKALYLVQCDADGKLAHVFATDGEQVVDTYTQGRRQKFEAPLPEEFRGHRVLRVFRIASAD